MEATKWLKPSISVSRIGDSASVQAVTRVNAEQSSKRTMRRPTRQPFRGRLIRMGEQSEEYAQPLRRGSGDSMYTRKAYATRETPRRGQDGGSRAGFPLVRIRHDQIDASAVLGCDRAVQIDVFADQLGGHLGPFSDRRPAEAE